jgi:hypothetical protein
MSRPSTGAVGAVGGAVGAATGAVGGAVGAATGAVGGAVGVGAATGAGAGAGAATGAVSLASTALTRADKLSSWADRLSRRAMVPGLAGVPVGLAGSIPNQASMAIVIAPDLVRPWAWACDSSKARVLPSNLAVMGNLAIIFLP